MDSISPKRRSANMRAIRSKDTSPEMAVRHIISKMGYRYRLHVKDLPGKPDIVFTGRQKVIFINGCFWHQHPVQHCADARMPRSNVDYWRAKLRRNIKRHAEQIGRLKADGWRILVIWDCETKKSAMLANRIERFLGT